MRALGLVAVLAALLSIFACSAPGPAALDTRSDACSWCRMAVSDQRFAAQLVAAADDPRFFDDVGCLASYLRAQRDLPKGVVAYVADHRTQTWVEASTAAYTKLESVETPMGSHLVAHADAASRGADPEAKGGTLLSPADVFGPSGPPRRAR